VIVNHRHDAPAIVIRDIESFDEMRAVEELQIIDVRYERIPLEPFKEPPGAESAPKGPRTGT